MPPSPRGDVLAAIDIGTNSVHLVVARVVADGDGPRFEILEQEKEMVRLGSSGGDMRQLAPDAIERGVRALRRFRQVADAHGARVAAVATSAVREAENRAVFIDRARDEAGVQVEVISGVEEARLIHLGVLRSVPAYDRKIVLCDIGGGSTELLVGERGDVLASRSLKLGAIRLTRRFFDGRLLHPAAVSSCRRHVRSTIVPFAREIRALCPEIAVGSSGTIVSLAELAARRAAGSRRRTATNTVLGRAGLDAIVAELIAAPGVEARARIPGMDARRADIILAGALILEQVMDELDLAELVVSGYALREGVLLDAWQRLHGGTLHHLSDLRRRSVLHLVELMDDDPPHSGHVARLALQLFDAARPLHGLGDAARELLEAAALLSNVGIFISHAQHHKHSYYVIRNSEQISGFTEHEVELIALVARYHRKASPKAEHPELAGVPPEDVALVSTLAALLRIAIGLDRTHAGAVGAVECAQEGDAVVVRAIPAAGRQIGLEVYAAEARKELLESVLGRPVRVEIAT